jgi:hypothetical protein
MFSCLHAIFTTFISSQGWFPSNFVQIKLEKDFARALFDYKAESEEELTLTADQLIEVNRDEMRFFALAHPPPTCAADHGEKRQWLVSW